MEVDLQSPGAKVASGRIRRLPFNTYFFSFFVIYKFIFFYCFFFFFFYFFVFFFFFFFFFGLFAISWAAPVAYGSSQARG